jgi:hypothetical protein
VDVGFVGGGTEVAEGGVQPAGVVPALDVLEYGPVQTGGGRPRAGVSVAMRKSSLVAT